MSGGNVTIKNTAHASIAAKAMAVVSITRVDYTVEEFNKFEKSLVTIARSVMSDHNGGLHGYAGLILNTAAYQKLLNSTTETFIEYVKPTRTAAYTAASTAVEIALAKEDHAADREQFYTQEGVKDALKTLILTKVPAETLVEIEDDDTEFENVTPLEMMTHLRTNARVTDVFDKKQLLDALNEPVDFNGELPLKGHFKNVDATIKLLKKHHIDASESIVMITILEQIKGHGDFKEEVLKWELKPAGQSWVDFKQYFSAADHERRQRDQYGAKTARTVGASANHVTTINDLKAYIDENLMALAHATTAGINAVLDRPQATSTAEMTTSEKKIDDKVKMLEAELKRLKAAANGKGSGNGDKDKKITPRCAHCNRYHPNVPAEKCWSLDANKTAKPEGWKPREKKQE